MRISDWSSDVCSSDLISGSLQAAARAERYRLLEQWRESHALDHVVTAHHADDQLETMIMRLNRSSGVGGLAGVRARNGTVLRPLLSWRQEEHTYALQSLMRKPSVAF